MNKVTCKNESSTIIGLDALNCPQGTILIVVAHRYNDSVGEYIMATSKSTTPFITLSNGNLWGNSIENYTFRRVTDIVEIKPVLI